MGLTFLKNFRKTLEKMENVGTSFGAPTKWYGSGNYALNKAMSGSFLRGIPVGRITCLAGPSGAGKSFLGCNMLANAQREGAFILVLDSENALDEGFMTAIGIDCSEDKLQYCSVTTFADVTEVLSQFVKAYEKDYGRDNPESPAVVIVLDSVDMLLTDSETANFDAGVQKGDQGQRAKQAKHMLRTMVSRTKRNPFSFIITHQVYPNTDLMNGQGLWIINNAIRYSASQIMLITPKKLKDDSGIIGIRMMVETYKSRFAKIGTKIEVEVPYTEGMNKFSGLVETLETMGVITKEGYSWVTTVNGEAIKFREKNLDDTIAQKLFKHPIIAGEEEQVSVLIADMVKNPEIIADGDDLEAEMFSAGNDLLESGTR